MRWKIASDGQTAGDGSLVSTGQAYHLVLVHRSGTLELYVDGALDYSVGSGAWIADVGDFRFGGVRDTSDNVTGRLDQIALYDSALSLSRIQAHHDAGSGA